MLRDHLEDALRQSRSEVRTRGHDWDVADALEAVMRVLIEQPWAVAQDDVDLIGMIRAGEERRAVIDSLHRMWGDEVKRKWLQDPLFYNAVNALAGSLDKAVDLLIRARPAVGSVGNLAEHIDRFVADLDLKVTAKGATK